MPQDAVGGRLVPFQVAFDLAREGGWPWFLWRGQVHSSRRANEF